jgi:hypothetical protein
MKWPKGKYNGQKIIGVCIKTRVIVNYWGFKVQLNKYLKFIHIGPVLMNFEFEYEWAKIKPQPK